MKKKISLLLLTTMLFTLLTGCNDKPNDSTTTVTTPDTVTATTTTEDVYQPTGELTIATRKPETLNPIICSDKKVDSVLMLIFDSLFTLDSTQKIVPNLVDTYEFSDSGLSLAIKLKDNVKWHNGEPVTAADVIFTIKQLKQADNNVLYKDFVTNIQRTTKVDDNNLVIYFSQATNTNITLLTFPIISEKYYSGKMSDSTVSMTPMGSGRYKFVEYSTMQTISLEKNENWHGGEVSTNNINCLVLNDDETEYSSYTGGVIDIYAPSVFDWSEFASDDNITPMEYTSFYYDFIGFNFNNNALNDANIRKLMAYAIDREAINKEVFVNHNVIVDSPFYPSAWYSTDMNIMYSYDEAKIDEYKKATGLTDLDGDGIWDKNGVELSFKLLVNNNDITRTKVAEKIKDQLSKVGIEIIIEVLDYQTYLSRVTSKDFDLFIGGWLLLPTQDYGFMFHSQGVSNYISYNSVMMDSLLTDAYNAYTDDTIKSTFTAVHKQVQEDLPYFSLYYRNSVVILGKNTTGNITPSTYNLYNGLENVVK